MALVRFQDADVRLADKSQDLRGRELRDAVGRPIGTIETMIVDTETSRVESAITADGREFPVRDLQIMEEAVYFVPDVATEPPPHAPAEPEAEVVHAEVAPVPPADVLVVEPVVVTPPDALPPEPASEAPAPAEPAPAEATGPDFHDHFQATYGDSGLDLTDLSPAYRFGYEAAAFDVRFLDRDFEDAEADLRRAYYDRYGYPASDRIVWNRIAAAVREGFRRAR